ncbi:hypothetical protein G9P44_000165 [Scheffersomyces stipitis]|nr:hypothetical protein G9P44_000165 [Scheffersomyces stipitis]
MFLWLLRCNQPSEECNSLVEIWNESNSVKGEPTWYECTAYNHKLHQIDNLQVTNSSDKNHQVDSD